MVLQDQECSGWIDQQIQSQACHQSLSAGSWYWLWWDLHSSSEDGFHMIGTFHCGNQGMGSPLDGHEECVSSWWSLWGDLHGASLGIYARLIFGLSTKEVRGHGMPRWNPTCFHRTLYIVNQTRMYTCSWKLLHFYFQLCMSMICWSPVARIQRLL